MVRSPSTERNPCAPCESASLAAVVALLAAPAASAHVLHTVAPGETLWSIAAQRNLTTRTVAAYNGLGEDADVVLGTTIKIPSVAEGQAALARRRASPRAAGARRRRGAPRRRRRRAGAGAPPPLGAYVVRPGDTLSALAAQTGVPARADGLHERPRSRPRSCSIGTVLKLPSGAPAPAQRVRARAGRARRPAGRPGADAGAR